MIIFGTRSKSIGTNNVGTACSYCQKNGTVWVTVYRYYFHIFWIPAFPLWLSASSECTHCKRWQASKEFGTELQLAFEDTKKSAKTPWWMYCWLLLVVTLFFLLAAVGIIKSA